MERVIELYRQRVITAPKTILGLVFLSGGLGLAYEIIYLNILSTYFYGDSWLINTSILLGVFLGLAVGAIFAGALVKNLWLLEFLLGITSLALGVLIKEHGLTLLHYIPQNHSLAALTAFFSGFIPLFIIGSHIPCYNLIIKHNLQTGKFTLIYALYSIAAAGAILATAYFLIPAVGAVNCLLAFGLVNIVLGFVLMPTCLRMPGQFSLTRFPMAHLLLLGAAATLWQSAFLDSAIGIYGPMNEIIVLVIFVSILGNSLGSFASFKIRSPVTAIYGIFATLGIYILATETVITTWAESQGATSGLILGLMVLHGLLVFVCFGALIPQLARPQKNGSWVLGFFSLGNGLGIGVYSLFIRGQQSLSFGLCVVIALLLVYLLFRERALPRGLVNCACAGVLAVGAYYYYPNEMIRLGTQARAHGGAYESYQKNFANEVIHLENYSSTNNIIHALTDGTNWTIINNGAWQYSLGRSAEHQRANWAVGAFLRPAGRKENNFYIIGGSDGFLLEALATHGAATVVEMTPARFELLAAVQERPLVPFALTVGDAFTLLPKSSRRFDLIVLNDLPWNYFSNAKFYTTEFFQTVRRQLLPAGFFAIKVRYRQAPPNSLTRTLEANFGACRHFAVLPAAYLHVCAPGNAEELARLQPAAPMRELFPGASSGKLNTLHAQINFH